MTKFETRLNDLYADTVQDYCQAFEMFEYMTNKSRGKHTTKQNIIKHYNNGTLGTLLKNYDPIAFNVQKSEMN